MTQKLTPEYVEASLKKQKTVKEYYDLMDYFKSKGWDFKYVE